MSNACPAGGVVPVPRPACKGDALVGYSGWLLLRSLGCKALGLGGALRTPEEHLRLASAYPPPSLRGPGPNSSMWYCREPVRTPPPKQCPCTIMHRCRLLARDRTCLARRPPVVLRL